jgi:hypothetical protein
MKMRMKKVFLYECPCCSSVLSYDMKEVLAKMGGICPFCRNEGKIGVRLSNSPKRIFDNISNAIDTRKVEAIFIDCNGVSNPRVGIRWADDYFRPVSWSGDFEFPEGFIKIATKGNSLLRSPVELVHYFDISILEDEEEFRTAVNDALCILNNWLRDMKIISS